MLILRLPAVGTTPAPSSVYLALGWALALPTSGRKQGTCLAYVSRKLKKKDKTLQKETTIIKNN